MQQINKFPTPTSANGGRAWTLRSKSCFGFIPILVFIPVSILALIMTVRALKSAHGYGTGAALGTIFLPGLVFCCIGALLGTLAGSLLTSLPFTISGFQ